MRIGLIECSTSQFKIIEDLTESLDSKFSDIQIVPLTCPDPSKIPVCSKRLIKEGTDSVIAFTTSTSEEATLLSMVSEKIMDIEIAEGKFIFLIVVYDDEARTEKQFKQIAISRIENSINSILGLSKVQINKDNNENQIDENSLDMEAGTGLKESSDKLSGDGELPPDGSSDVHSLF